MKKTVFIAAAVLLVAACAPKHNGYVITGTIDGVETGVVVLANGSTEEPVADTATIHDGKFTFTGNIKTPSFVSLTINNNQENGFTFFLDNSKVAISIGDTATLYKTKITGSKLVEDVAAIRYKVADFLNGIHDNRAELLKEYYDLTTDAQRKQEIVMAYSIISEQEDSVTTALHSEYMKNNPYSPYTVALHIRALSDYSTDTLATIVESLKAQPSLEGNRYLQALDKFLTNARSTEAGQVAPDFTQNDTLGNPRTFSDVYKKNRLTMIDFWASWCGPCRRFNPTLVKLYEKYHPNGFEIFAVSLDESREKWTAAIAKDKLAWYHVSDVQGWNNAVAKQYNIRYIPQNVFVDAEGKIVAKQVSETELEALLEEQLK
jgi:thiol-disulfide isomerase/thioredoxin